VTVLPGQDLVIVRLIGDAPGDVRNGDTTVNDYVALALKAWERGPD
jgi:hypothetical protein